MQFRKHTVAIMAIICMLSSSLAAESALRFTAKGKLIGRENIRQSQLGTIYEYYGETAENRPIIAIGKPVRDGSRRITKGSKLTILKEDGSIQSTLHEDGLRAYPSPSGKMILILDREYRITLQEGDREKELNLPGRAVLAAWSNDETEICFTLYPEKWSPFNLENAKSPKEFIELANSDLWRYELSTGQATQLTNSPGADYSAIYSPDGENIFFLSDMRKSGKVDFHLLNRNTGDIQAISPITDKNNYPIGRSDSYSWQTETNRIYYEAQNTDQSSEIWSIGLDGKPAEKIAKGSQPKLDTSQQNLYYLNPNSEIAFKDIQNGGAK